MDKELKSIIKKISKIGGVLGFSAKLCLNKESMAKQFVKDMGSQIHKNTLISEELKERITNYLKKMSYDIN